MNAIIDTIANTQSSQTVDQKDGDLLKALGALEAGMMELSLEQMSMIGGGQNIPCPV